MSITIKCNTSWVDLSDRFTLRLKGEATTKIAHNEEMKLDVPREGARLKIKGFGYKSNEIKVNDGDVVEITTRKIRYVPFILTLIYIVFLTSFPTPEQQLIVLAVLFTVSAVTFFLFHTHQLEIVDTGQPPI